MQESGAVCSRTPRLHPVLFPAFHNRHNEVIEHKPCETLLQQYSEQPVTYEHLSSDEGELIKPPV